MSNDGSTVANAAGDTTAGAPTAGDTTGLALYARTAQHAAAAVIAAYSTSFGIATSLLGPRVRPHVRNIYALVRIADEIVDGSAAEAGLSAEAQRAVLDDLEAETLTAITRGYSSNLIVHTFADTARECAIEEDLIRPFFASMRTDLDTSTHDADSHDAYVYGSAEVVGLMCLQVFVCAGTTSPTRPSPRSSRELGDWVQRSRMSTSSATSPKTPTCSAGTTSGSTRVPEAGWLSWTGSTPT